MVCLLVLVCALASSLTRGQGLQVEKPPPGAEKREMFTVAGGDSMPMPFYFTVGQFYRSAYVAFRAGEEMFYWNVLRMLAVEPGSPAALAIEDALVRAQPLLKAMLPMESGISEEVWQKKQHKFWMSKARQLASIYKSMIVALKDAGVEPTTVRQYLEEEIAPTGAIFSTEPDSLSPGSDFFTVCEEFERLIAIEDTP
jgi:hypothetical protein